ncbi:MAG: PHP domain-containing protein [Clostridia bacterium]
MPIQSRKRGDFICPYANWMTANFEVKRMHATEEYAADLHLHSTFSDGLMSPAELCAQADRLGLTHVALSDHDTMDGLPEMEAAAQNVRSKRRERGSDAPFVVLPCVELSTGHGGRTHLLGYGANPQNPELAECLHEADEDRRERSQKIVELLLAQGVELSEDVKAKLIGPHVGRAHVARALVQVGAVTTMKQAFERYLGEGRSAYVSRKWLETTKAVQILQNAGAVTVLAHPQRLLLEGGMLFALIDELAAFGLCGIEVFHPSANHRDVRALELFARRRGLLVTGGSDYHGDLNTRVRMGKLPSGWLSMREDVDALLNAMKCK